MDEKMMEEIINMLDQKTSRDVSRIKVFFDEQQSEECIRQEYHHGRCDIGSPWAKGTVPNF